MLDQSREVAIRQFDGKRAKPTSPGLARELHLRLQTDLDGMGAPPKLLLPPLPPLRRRGAWGASGAKEDVVVAILRKRRRPVRLRAGGEAIQIGRAHV